MGNGSPESVVRCALCGEPLGVYEPLVEVNGSEIARTSRAARPDLPAAAAGSTFHAACFAQQQELIADG